MTHHPIQIEPPDITPYRHGNARVDYVHVFDSGRRGPNVMLQALTHGNEFCGAIALDYLFTEGVRPRTGRLTLAFANVAAYERFDFDDPDRSRFIDEDYNRVWGDEVLLGARDSAELRRARELRPFVDAADLLLDLHSMHEPCRPIMVCGKSEKSVALSWRIGVPADLLVDTGHPAGLRMIERGDFNDPQSSKAAVLIECGQHWEAQRRGGGHRHGAALPQSERGGGCHMGRRAPAPAAACGPAPDPRHRAGGGEDDEFPLRAALQGPRGAAAERHHCRHGRRHGLAHAL